MSTYSASEGASAKVDPYVGAADGTAEAVNLYEAPASGNYWAAFSVSGLLIHAVVGSVGGWGSLRTKRSGWAA